MNRLLIVLGLVFWFAAAPAQAGTYNSVLSIGDKMPNFANLPTTSDTMLSASDLKASVVVLVSLANHCPWVKGMDRDLVNLANEFKGQDVAIVGVSVNRKESDRMPAMKEHAAKTGYSFTYVYDESQQLGRQLGATRTPEYFVFDKDRKLVYTGLIHNSPARMDEAGKIHYTDGEPKTFYVRDAVAATLAGKAVATPETKPHGCSVKYE